MTIKTLEQQVIVPTLRGNVAAAVIVFFSLTFTSLSWAESAAVHNPDQLDFSMFFLADVRDSPECHVHVNQGKVAFGDAITNPALSCPDAFAWKLFIEAVTAGFWENWSTNRQVWPSDPWPRCAPGQAPGECCAAVEISNRAWPEHCPVFPGPTPGMPEESTTEPAIAQQITLSQAAIGDKDHDGKPEWEDVPAALRNAVIGSVQGELVYRNEAMVDYVFTHELYSSNGLGRVFDNLRRVASVYAPYWPVPDDPAEEPDRAPPITTITFPIKALMIKTDWLPVEVAPSVGIDPDDPVHPFIIMDLVPIESSNKPPIGGAKTKPHILLSFHISSKDLPNWFWATFEHVANQGRCDWTGCNDSFGYLATAVPEIDKSRSGALLAPERNFTPPHETTKAAGYDQSAFALAERYLDVDSISEPLDAILSAYQIGTSSGINRTGRPTPRDFAWRSYRLKGTQTDFVTPSGHPTRLGNSVTEAGFVNTASCITCHARAGATKEGTPPLAIFDDKLSDIGLPQSVNGTPNDAWFTVNAYRNANGVREATDILAVQTDFVWGFRNACPMKRAIGPSWCKNLPPSSK
jgi:hypothetical protein